MWIKCKDFNVTAGIISVVESEGLCVMWWYCDAYDTIKQQLYIHIPEAYALNNRMSIAR
jgi:hypothetical protein